MIIRPYEARDCQSVREIFLKANRDLAPPDLADRFTSYVAAALSEEIDKISEYYRPGARRGFWVAQDQTDVIGFFGIEPAGARACEIRRMYVAPERRRLGVGRRLLAEAERQCLAHGAEKAMLSTSEIQSAAIAMYRSAGYRVIRELKADEMSSRTVGGGIRRFIFEKTLKPSGEGGTNDKL
jgi:putative acetyltransferase